MMIMITHTDERSTEKQQVMMRKQEVEAKEKVEVG